MVLARSSCSLCANSEGPECLSWIEVQQGKLGRDWKEDEEERPKKVKMRKLQEEDSRMGVMNERGTKRREQCTVQNE